MSRFHFPAALALACSLLLVACSSGDSGPPQAQLDAEAARDAALAAQMEAEAARDAALAAQMKAEADEAAAVAAAQDAAADAAEARAEAAQAAADLAAAQASQMEAETARDAALAAQMEAETARDAALAAQMEAETARDAALAAQMTAEASRDAAIAARDRLQAQLDAIQDQQDLEDNKDAAAMARQIFAALSSATAFEPNPTFTARHNMPASLATVEVVDPVSTITATTMGTSISAMGSWSGTEFSRKSGSVTDTVQVYSNIGPGERGSFTDWATTAGNLETTGVANTITGVVDSVSVGDAGDAQYVAGSVFASGSGTKTHAHNTDTDDDVANGYEAFRTRGTLNGASGTYNCAGTCTSAVAAQGITLTGTWTFMPDGNAMVLNPDTVYQYFGWWLRANGDGTYLIDTFANQVGSTAVDTATLRGSARYAGRAAGKYALYPGPSAGHFTANVRLAATFAVAGTTISGTVDGFSGGSGMSDWSVDLPELSLSAGTNVDVATDEDEMPTWTIGDADLGAAGTWGVTLYDAADAMSPRAGTPQSAIGEFEAHHGVLGRMEGAFGADLQ